MKIIFIMLMALLTIIALIIACLAFTKKFNDSEYCNSNNLEIVKNEYYKIPSNTDALTIFNKLSSSGALNWLNCCSTADTPSSRCPTAPPSPHAPLFTPNSKSVSVRFDPKLEVHAGLPDNVLWNPAYHRVHPMYRVGVQDAGT